MKKIQFIFQGLKLPLDFILIIIGGLLAYYLRFTNFFINLRPILFNLTFKQWLFYIILIALISVFIMAINGLYSTYVKNNLLIEIFRVLFSLTTSFFLFILYGFLARNLFESRFILFSALAISFSLLLIERLLLVIIEMLLYIKNTKFLNQVLIIGENQYSQKLIQYFQDNARYGYKVAKTIKELDLNQIKKIILNCQIDDIILTQSNINQEDVHKLSYLCQEKAINFKYIPTLLQMSLSVNNLEQIKGIALMETKISKLEGWGRTYKRIFDFLMALILLLIVMPIFIIVSFFIKIDSAGPIFAKIPHRVGFRGKTFYMYKFRTMIYNAAQLKKNLLKYNERLFAGPLFKIKNDPRITRFGKILRRTRIDEFPQLINVIKGDMSLVGPRPHEIEEVKKYEPHQKRVLGIKPGITGLAQISGAHNLPFETENKLDLYYITNWSPLLDLKILFQTFIFMFKDRSAV